jgi:hypothetical protein
MTYEQIKNNYLSNNPTHLDYLLAIRAAASRGGSLSRIYQLADEGIIMQNPIVKQAADVLEEYIKAIKKITPC